MGGMIRFLGSLPPARIARDRLALNPGGVPPKSSHVYCHANPPGDVIERLAIAPGVEEQRPWEKQRPCEGRGLFFLIGLTRAKGNAVQLLDLAQVMLKDDVGQLVGDIADADQGSRAGFCRRQFQHNAIVTAVCDRRIASSPR